MRTIPLFILIITVFNYTSIYSQSVLFPNKHQPSDYMYTYKSEIAYYSLDSVKSFLLDEENRKGLSFDISEYYSSEIENLETDTLLYKYIRATEPSFHLKHLSALLLNKDLSSDKRAVLLIFKARAIALTDGGYFSAIEYLEEALKLANNDQNLGNAYYETLVNIYMFNKSYKTAIETCKSWKKKYPASVEPYKLSAITYMFDYKYKKAQKELNKALKINNKWVDLYVTRAALYNTTKNYNEALTDINNSLLLDKKYGLAYLERAKANIGLKRKDEVCLDLYSAKTYSSVSNKSLAEEMIYTFCKTNEGDVYFEKEKLYKTRVYRATFTSPYDNR